VPVDPLKFRDERRYTDRIKDARGKTGSADAVLVAPASSRRQDRSRRVRTLSFSGGSLGTAAGEAVISGMRTAVKHQSPFILFALPAARACRKAFSRSCKCLRTTVAVQGAARGEASLCRRAHQPDHRRRHRLLRHAGRLTLPSRAR
jgi:acetyl-CoA carboxylase carboxyl transferase subunit beta